MTDFDDFLQRLTRKKEELEKYQPLPVELVKNIDEWLRVELTYNSNAIEGNTLTRLETAEIIERGTAAVISGKPLRDQIEAINHAKATEFIQKMAKEYRSHQFIKEEDILAIHKIILGGINDDWAGKYRNTEVFIKGADVEFPLPFHLPRLMRSLIFWLENQQETHPVKTASDAHFKLVSIHPFIDGNGRTARLLMNLILLINGYPLAVVQNKERIRYFKAVNRGQTENDLEPFYIMMAETAERSLDAYLAAAQGKSAISSFKS